MDKQIKLNKQLQQFLYKELIRISLMVDGTITEPQIFGQMSALVKKARYQVNGETTELKINQLLDLVYNEWGFHCHHQEYFHTENLLIHKVLRQRRGMPVSLGAVVLYLAAAINLPLYPVNFPTQLIIRADYINDANRQTTRFINPWSGQDLSFQQLEKWLEGEIGFEAEMSMEFTKIADCDELLERLETVAKMALTREGKYEEALRLIEYRLFITPNDPYEIRDRGMVLASLDCYQAAVDDLNYFIEQCPDDPSALMLKLEMPTLLKQTEIHRVH
ncbi:SirB1 family protein [Phocoenobacter skyensis]|uniref:Regulator of sirC expression, contains transglutaminase-like and TPR domains n=1 Tax=Phocoenobacter skyensis TaxID=97481 RepID=A0A1H7V2Z4_9PAST|nr:tetratricopeptide repeat protein [Pasteurella skyensis]MDP8078458.1 tetratricopeptide repeat protein [Pasteurella skyensis]MDP8084450.1 tetratricopeptide repeat protein [Pasteurella skyensis]MDP8170438.1 tetratricopeptide repeat protein [Pasteurella skyensis]MDP8175027.1 tetratricopeptide repeat protein [Pasteurella skyensis]MDP8184781.1 tetratricopeptide repeat protein [Pasteurella skyensis]